MARTRQEQGTERTAMLLGERQIRALQKAHVMLFGLGGVGSYAAEALGRMGVGKMTIVDGDQFEISNLNRQLGALNSTIGQSKVSVTAKRLLDISPGLAVIPVNQFYLPDAPVAIADDVDFVVDAIDTVAAKIHIIETCKARKIHMISCMGMGNRMDPTQIKIGDLFDTTYCALCRVMRKELRKRGIDTLRCVYSTEEAAQCDAGYPPENGRRSIPGSVAYVPSVAGLYMAYEAVNTICACDNLDKEE